MKQSKFRKMQQPDETPPKTASEHEPDQAGSEHEQDPTAAWTGLMAKMKSDAPKKALKRPPKNKSNKPKKPAGGKSSSDEARKPLSEKHKKWLEREQWMARKRTLPNGFDDQVHGYWRSKEGLFYKHPDGRVTPATGVDAWEAE